MMQSDVGKLHLDQCAPLLDVLLDAKDDTALAKVVLSFLWIHEVVRPSASACSGGASHLPIGATDSHVVAGVPVRPPAPLGPKPFSQCSRSQSHALFD
jgi:hypothetical protein